MAGLELNRGEPSHVSLMDAARRVADLLSSAQGLEHQKYVVAILDYLNGAIHGLALSVLNGYEHKNQPTEAEARAETAEKAVALAAGMVATDGGWVARFSFNSALVRIAAVYHRALKLAINKPKSSCGVGDLSDDAKRLYAGWDDSSARCVHREVNKIKHETLGLYGRRKVTLEDAIKAIGEVLQVIDRWQRSVEQPKSD